MPTLLQILLLGDDHALEEMTAGPRQREEKDLTSRFLVWCHSRCNANELDSILNCRLIEAMAELSRMSYPKTDDSKSVNTQGKIGTESALMATARGVLDGTLNLSRVGGPTADCRRISARETRTREQLSARKLMKIERLLDREGVGAIAKES